MWRHDPAAILGFSLIGCFAVLYYHVQIKMLRAGYITSYDFSPYRGWAAPFRYLKVRAKHDWSPWPAYLLFPCLIAGVALLVFGLFRL